MAGRKCGGGNVPHSLQLVFEVLVIPGFISTWGRCSTSILVKFSNDGLNNILHFLLLCLQLISLGLCIFLKPTDLLVDNLLNLLLLLVAQLSAKLFFVANLVLQTISIALQLISRLHSTLQLGVLVGKLLCVIYHPPM